MRDLPRPFLKWAGGKTRLLAELTRRLPAEFATYHEPFLGGGALFFHLAGKKRLARATLSDVNANLVDTYVGVRDDLEGVLEHLRDHARRHDREHYYRVRDDADAGADRAARAARLIYLNRTCYNGLYRESRAGRFNVPMGRYRNPTICDEPRLRAASQALQAADLLCAPFASVLERARPGDLVYMDPPYQPRSVTASFTSYHQGGFPEEEQRRLGRVFRRLAQGEVAVVLSNSATALVSEIYAGFRQDEVLVSRPISRRAAGRGAVPELIIRGGPGFLDTPQGEG